MANTRFLAPTKLSAILGVTLSALALSACATSTPYKPQSSSSRMATGYASQQISSDQFRVSFVGNSLTSRETVENYLLYRAAELTRERGYDGFTLIERDTEKRTDVRVDSFGAGPYGYWGPSWRYRRGGLGWNYWDPYYGDPFWNRSVDVRTVDNYEAFATIKMYRGTRPDDRSFDANEVLRNLGPTIILPKS